MLAGLDTGADGPQAPTEGTAAAALPDLAPEALRRDLVRVAERTLGLEPLDG